MAGRELFDGEEEKIDLSARNVVLQYDEIRRLVDRSRGQLRLTRRKIRRLHLAAMRGIYSCAGSFRTWPVAIRGSSHEPPDHRSIPGHIANLCLTLRQYPEWGAVEVAAYILWRLNWIHPFGGGNGRTSRAVAYYALCAKLGFMPPGRLTIPEQIVGDRSRYRAALEDADAAWRESAVIDVAKMESLLRDYLARQLASSDESRPDH